MARGWARKMVPILLHQGYVLLLGGRPAFRYCGVVWNSFILPKHSLHLWLLLLRHILTLDRIAQWYKAQIENACVLCSDGVMRRVVDWLGISRIPMGNNRWRSQLGHCGKCKSFHMGVKMASVAAVTHWLWRERNERRHGQVSKQPEVLVCFLL